METDDKVQQAIDLMEEALGEIEEEAAALRNSLEVLRKEPAPVSIKDKEEEPTRGTFTDDILNVIKSDPKKAWSAPMVASVLGIEPKRIRLRPFEDAGHLVFSHEEKTGPGRATCFYKLKR